MEESFDETHAHAGLRGRQERSLAMSHRLTAMEFALAHEAAAAGRMFALAGVPFDSRTFVGMRLLEASVVEAIEPADVLRVLDERGALDRSVSLADGLLQHE